MTTTPTGVPITRCDLCRRPHSINLRHCDRCGRASTFITTTESLIRDGIVVFDRDLKEYRRA